MFLVDFWGSYPLTNDDCWYGEKFDDLEKALTLYNEECLDRDVAWIILDGPGISLERKNPNFKEAKIDSDWQRETAHQAGMGLGVEAYNDYMGC